MGDTRLTKRTLEGQINSGYLELDLQEDDGRYEFHVYVRPDEPIHFLRERGRIRRNLDDLFGKPLRPLSPTRPDCTEIELPRENYGVFMEYLQAVYDVVRQNPCLVSFRRNEWQELPQLLSDCEDCSVYYDPADHRIYATVALSEAPKRRENLIAS